jgi:hypothetical protein
MDMPDLLNKNNTNHTPNDGVVKKLVKSDLLVAAEAFGARLDEKKRTSIDPSTCSEEDFLKRALKIAEICEDKLLAERAKQRIDYPGLKYDLSPAILSAMEIYSERFYSYLEDGKLIYIRSEISDFPQLLNTARKKADKIFSLQEIENIIVVCCNKERAQKLPLLCKLLNNIIETETIRVGYVYPVRKMTYKVLFDIFERMKELLLIREQHDSSLQLGEHPEELIPYVWANIIKSLLGNNLSVTTDNINALSYLHYAAQETESTTGTEAYSKLKKELVLFKEGKQRNWPNEVRKMFMDSTMVEALIRYRFTHGLIAVNTALAYRYVEKGEQLYLEPWEEDAIVLNGLITTETGHLRSSGFHDAPIKEQFQRDVHYFKELKKVIRHENTDRFGSWHKEMKNSRKGLEDKIASCTAKIAAVIQEKKKEIQARENLLKNMVLKKDKARKSIFTKLRSGSSADGRDKTERLGAKIEKDKEDLKSLLEITQMHKDMAKYIKKTTGFFS